MKLKSMNRNQLDSRLKKLVKVERSVLYQIIQVVAEIDERKVYLDFGYSNTYAYLTKHIGYANGSAQRRIDAARLLSEVPAMGAMLANGEIKLHHATLIQQAVRQVEENSSNKVPGDQKADLVRLVAQRQFHDAQEKVAAFFDIPVLVKTKIQNQADGSVRVEMTLSKELYADIQWAQSLYSHSLGSSDLVKYVEYVTARVIKQKTSIRPKPKVSPTEMSSIPDEVPAKDIVSQEEIMMSQKIFPPNQVSMPEAVLVPNKVLMRQEVFLPKEAAMRQELNLLKDPVARTEAPPMKVSRALGEIGTDFQAQVDLAERVPVLVAGFSIVLKSSENFSLAQKKIILQRDPCCQFVDPLTGIQCEARWFLQSDHIQPIWAGGTADLENGQTLCAAHNRQKYFREVGIRPLGRDCSRM